MLPGFCWTRFTLECRFFPPSLSSSRKYVGRERHSRRRRHDKRSFWQTAAESMILSLSLQEQGNTHNKAALCDFFFSGRRCYLYFFLFLPERPVFVSFNRAIDYRYLYYMYMYYAQTHCVEITRRSWTRDRKWSFRLREKVFLCFLSCD